MTPPRRSRFRSKAAHVTAARIAIGVAHRDQAAAVKRALGCAAYPVLSGSGGTRRWWSPDTANRLQGREFDVTIMLHPLSGRRDATAFHLEAAACVLASRTARVHRGGPRGHPSCSTRTRRPSRCTSGWR